MWGLNSIEYCPARLMYTGSRKIKRLGKIKDAGG